MKRRDYLTGVATIGALGAAGSAQATDVQYMGQSLAVGDDTYHPGEPRFVQVGERLVEPPGTGQSGGDHLAPQIKGGLQQDPDNFDASDFEWSVASKPSDSSATVQYAFSDEGAPERYDAGKHNVAEFILDVPGTYVLEVDAPDDTHQVTIEVFAEIPDAAGGPPTVTLDGTYDADAGEYVIDGDVDTGTNSGKSIDDLTLHALADDRDALSTEDVTVEGHTVRIPDSAVTEDARLHVVAYNGKVLSTKDTVELNADGSVDHPNRPPEWLYDAVMYQIFPRSFNGLPERSANFDNITDRVDYLTELGVDLLWLTPVVPAESSNWKRRNSIEGNAFPYVGGGPHGYDANSYFDVAADLGSGVPFSEYKDDEQRLQDARDNALEEYRQFVQKCHENDIKVCFDFVINHGGRHHPFFQNTIESKGSVPDGPVDYKTVESWNTSSKYFDWFDRLDEPNTLDDGTQVEAAPGTTFFAGFLPLPEWNYGNVALREHILAAADFWSGEVGVDGFRCDIAYGVPHDFWKEVREVVRANDREFMMLDETIPYQRSFSENEFDMHYDKVRLRDGAVAVAQGNLPFQQLVDRKRERDLVGVPDHTLLLNFTENHDEQRMLKLAQTGSRSDPAKAQRAVWAACVTLPGVPSIYYGQERQITNFGTNRHDLDGSGQDPRDGDIGPGKYKRAFMNWQEYPESHFQFYKDVVATYKNTEVLKPQYDLIEPFFRKNENDTEDVLVFGRTGDDVSDALVVCNVGEGTTEVDIRPGIDPIDSVSGANIQNGTSGVAQTVEVDTLAVIETDSLYDLGSEIASLGEPSGDGTGPGNYTYPTGSAYSDGVFDITGLTAHDGGNNYQFKLTVGGPLENPDGLPEGFTAQHLQLYLRDPGAQGGSMTGRAGTNVNFDTSYQYRIVADGQNGVRVEDASGSELATGSIQTNAVQSAIVVEFPKSVLDAQLTDHGVSALMCGYDPSAEGNVMQVEGSAGANTFGGAENDNAPNVIDVVAPQNVPQSSLLDYDAELPATLQYVPLRTPYTEVRPAITDPSDDNLGPGDYTMATNGDFYDGAMDVETLTVLENRSRLRFDFDMAALNNPFGLGDGFSHEFFQVYIRDTGAADSATTGTAGRQGTQVQFAQPYHYRVLAKGENKFPDSVEDPQQGVVTDDVVVSVDGTTISVDVPKSAVTSSDVSDLQIAPLVFPYDGYSLTGRDADYIRGFAESVGGYTIGAPDASNAPRVMDMVVGQNAPPQSQQLSYDSGTATVQYLPLGGGPASEVVSVTDPEDDNKGAGNLTHPTSSDFYDGAWDIREFTVKENTTRTFFQFDLATLDNENAFELPRGWSHEYFNILVRDPDAGDDVPANTNGPEGLNANTGSEHHYRILVNGEKVLRVEQANGVRVTRDIETSVEGTTVTFDVPRSAIGGGIRDKEVAVLVAPFDGLTQNYYREFGDSADEYVVGTTDPGAPKIMDMIVPDGENQSGILGGTGFGTTEVPLVPPEQLGGGQTDSGGGGQPELTLPGQSSPAASTDGDPLMEDVDGSGEANLFDALTYYNEHDSDVIRNNPDQFDFDGDGQAGTLFDALELYNEIS